MVYTGLLIFTLTPLLSAFAASEIAYAAGAKLDEGSVHPCIIWGHDFGELLYSMFVVFWFSLVTLPVGGLAIIVFTIYLLLRKKEPIQALETTRGK